MKLLLFVLVLVTTTHSLPLVESEATNNHQILTADPIIVPLSRKTVSHQVVVQREQVVGDNSSVVSFLANHKTTQYVGPIWIGTPQQKLDMIWDTGSSNTWVYAKECSTEVCKNHRRFDHTKSTTYQKGGKGMVIKYGSGDIEGTISTERVSFCPNENNNNKQCTVFAEKLKFGEVTWTEGDAFLYGAYDGIVGLGFPSLAIDGTLPPFDVMFAQGRFNNPVFGFYMTHEPNQPGSSLSIGGIQSDKFVGDVKWHSLFVKDKTPEYWTVKLSDVLINNQSLGVCHPNGCPMAVDTGTSLVTGPSHMINKLISKVHVDEDCRNTKPLPQITLVIDNTPYNLDPADYVLKVEDMGQSVCLGGFRDLDLPPEKGPLWIAGDVFLRRYYSVYDRNGLRVGLAKSKI